MYCETANETASESRLVVSAHRADRVGKDTQVPKPISELSEPTYRRPPFTIISAKRAFQKNVHVQAPKRKMVENPPNK